MAIAALAAVDDPLTHVNVKRMSGDWSGCGRLRVGGYRAIFHLVDVDGTVKLEVLAVGPRGDIYG